LTSPLISSLAAHMLVTGVIVPWWRILCWLVVIAVLGVFLAFPMKRRFINGEQLPFPEGRACGVVLDALHHGKPEQGLFKARLLGWTALPAGFDKFITGDGWMRLLQLKILRMDKWTDLTEPWHFRERIDDDYYYLLAAKYELWTPKILGTDVRQFGLRFTLDAAMLGVGGLMGIRVASSVMLGAFINFFILAPIMIQRGNIAARLGPTGALVAISAPRSSTSGPSGGASR